MREPCDLADHDFRRVYGSDLRSAPRDLAEGTVLAVVCCNCGISPIRAFGSRVVAAGAYRVNGDWPFDHTITNYFYDEEEGPSVEFTIEGSNHNA